MEKSILFVDDEKAILNSIKREIFDTNYKTYFAENGKEALKILYENDNINMVVSDLMMPEMDGYELLKNVKYLYPDLIRIVLSGYANKPLMLKCINKNIAKVYINKPWEKEDFINTINDIFDSYDRLNQNNIKDIIENTDKLPTIPMLFLQINKLIEDDNSSIEDIVNIINKDQSMAYKVLKTINSAFYGIKTGSIKTAILNLGLTNLKSILTALELFDFEGNNFYKKLLWEHSNLTNSIAIEFYEAIYKKEIPEQYSTAGLLHDIGKVIFFKLFNKKYENLFKIKDEDNKIDLLICEKNIFDCTHEELGSYVLNWWQLPHPIVETALRHSNPLSANKDYRDIVCIVHLADYYSWQVLYPKFMPNVNNEVYKYLNITKYKCQNIVNYYKDGGSRI